MTAPTASSKRMLRWLLVPVLLFGAYQGVLVSVRSRVDGLIEKSRGRPLPAFRLTDENGQVFTPESLKGKLVVLNFTRSRCHGCEVEKPELKAFAAELDPEQVVLLSVMTDRVMGFAPEVTQRTLERGHFQHPILMADEAFVDAFHGAGWAKVTPVTYVADRNGRIITSLRGAQTLESFRRALRETEAD